MRAGITGGTGFVGRRIVALHVARDDQVRVLSRRSAAEIDFEGTVEIHRGDLTTATDDLKAFADGLDVLYHCAGETRNESPMRKVHVQGTERLLHAAAGRIGHWVQLSSVGAYGRCQAGTVTESEATRPEGEYEVTKTEAEALALRMGSSLGFTVSVLRPCKIIGIGMGDRSLYTMFPLVARGMFFYIGKAGALLNYVHVDDVARALVVLAANPVARGKTYNLARQITVEDFAISISNTLGTRPPRIRLPDGPTRFLASITAWIPRNPLTVGRINGLTSRTLYSSDRIVDELGFTFEVPIQAAIRELVDDWRSS